MKTRRRLLVVARWPLGGIRTYMRYVYRFLPDCYEITLVAASTHEDEALQRDSAELGIRLQICDSSALTGAVFREFQSGGYELVQSHGFISALHVSAANLLVRVPHVLTVHGILEDKLLGGILGRIKLAIISMVIRNVDVLYAVSNDILLHLMEEVNGLETSRSRKVVIHNGIDVYRFNGNVAGEGVFRKSIGIGGNIFLIGFLGRFMQQKGFNYLIDAVEVLKSEGLTDFRVLAVGSGDYQQHYQDMVRERGLEGFFNFMPFCSDVVEVYRELDAVVMPSIWEASGLLAMEALCMGIPLVSSNCIGLRETVQDTPALVFESRDSRALALGLHQMISHSYKAEFERFAPIARERFDVRRTAKAVHEMFNTIGVG